MVGGAIGILPALPLDAQMLPLALGLPKTPIFSCIYIYYMYVYMYVYIYI